MLHSGVSIDKLLVQLTDADIEDMLATNVKGALYLSRSVVKGMIRKRTGESVSLSTSFDIEHLILSNVF